MPEPVLIYFSGAMATLVAFGVGVSACSSFVLSRGENDISPNLSSHILAVFSLLACVIAAACLTMGGKFVYMAKTASGSALNSDCGLILSMAFLVAAAAALFVRRSRIPCEEGAGCGSGGVKVPNVDVAYFTAMVFSIGSFALMNGSADMNMIALSQSGGVMKWNALCAPVSAIVFIWSAVSIADRGGRACFSGPAFWFVSALFAAVVFFGAWDVPSISPEALYVGVDGYIIDELAPLAVFGVQFLVVLVKSLIIALLLAVTRNFIVKRFGSIVDPRAARVALMVSSVAIVFSAMVIAFKVM